MGKSTLFNRLIEQRKAIVEDTPGVTRDRLFGTSEWGGTQFTVIDTGGFVAEDPDEFARGVREQVQLTLQQADVVVFMVDGKTGLMPQDQDVAQLLRRQEDRPVLVAVNKVDSKSRDLAVAEFYSLGFEQLTAVSAINGSGVGDLLDEIVATLERVVPEEAPPELPRFAIVGRPNVGKSSFVNALLGEAAHIVTDIPGTTRDALYTRYTGFEIDCFLVDTAGLRKKARVSDNIEYYAALRTIRAIEECDVALLMLDGTQGIEMQDLKILHQIVKRKKGLVILVNKWDIVEKDKTIDRDYRKLIEERIAPLQNIPILFTSNVEKRKLVKSLQAANEVYENRNRIIKTSTLNDELLPVIQENPPPSKRGRHVKIKFITQVPAAVPTFLFFTNYPDYVRDSYKRFLEKQIRQRYGFAGWPLQLVFKKKK